MSEAEAGRALEEALDAAGIADMRPAYRKMLVRLKQSQPADFEEATRRFREELEPAVAAGDVEPISAWLDYGRWLADRVIRGRVVTVDRSGRARPLDPEAEPGHDAMVLHLPDDERAFALLLSAPRKPSRAQRTTADLLVR